MNALDGKETVLVTGADGFTGRHLLPHLVSQGFRALGTMLPGSLSQMALACDLTRREDVDALIRRSCPDYVIHLAGISFVPHADIRAIYEANLLGTLNLLHALADSGRKVRKIVLASSANVYGNPPSSPVSESTPAAPLNHYAASKLAMEHMASQWFGDLPIIIVRPFNYTGVGQAQHFLIPKIVGAFRARRSFIELGNIDVIRDFSDVRDVVGWYSGLILSEVRGEIVNLCSGTGYSVADILQTMNELAEYELEIRVNKEFVRNNEIQTLIGDRSKLKRIIGPLENRGFSDTLEWMYSASDAEHEDRPNR